MSTASDTQGNESPTAPAGATSQNEADLAEALAKSCRVVLIAKGKSVTAAIPELGVLVRAADPASAHAEALRLREQRVREFAEEGLLNELPSPTVALSGRERLLPRLKIFLIKAAIITAMFLGAVNVISGGLRDAGYVLEKKLDAVATWSPETAEKHRKRAEVLAKNLNPILQEFTKPASAPATPQAQAAANATAAQAPQ